MKKSLTALVAVGALALATVSTTQPARALDPWTAAAWFVGGLFIGGAFVAPAYGYGRSYAYSGPYGYAPTSGPYGYAQTSGHYGYAPRYASASWDSQQCYPARVQRGGNWYSVRVCY